MCVENKSLGSVIFFLKESDIEQQIRMISEGSCDPKDWSNEAENSSLISNKSHFTIYSTAISNCNKISKYNSFYCNFLK